MVVTPVESPVTMPVAMLTVATAGVELVHVPPGVLLVSVIVLPSQTADGPDIGPWAKDDAHSSSAIMVSLQCFIIFCF